MTRRQLFLSGSPLCCYWSSALHVPVLQVFHLLLHCAGSTLTEVGIYAPRSGDVSRLWPLWQLFINSLTLFYLVGVITGCDY
ncbi:hypothetical protein FKM82_003001 [Ascaphus truei]